MYTLTPQDEAVKILRDKGWYGMNEQQAKEVLAADNFRGKDIDLRDAIEWAGLLRSVGLVNIPSQRKGTQHGD